jgi:hypothetical protein
MWGRTAWSAPARLDVGQRPAQDLFLARPAGLVHHQHRRIFRPAGRAQRRLHLVHEGDRQEDAQGAAVRRQAGQVFAVRHRGAAFDAREDHGLRDFRQRHRFARRRHRRHGGRHARHHRPFDAGGRERARHLDQRAVQAGVAGLQAHHGAVQPRVLDQPGRHLFQRHVLGIADDAAGRRVQGGGAVDQGTGKQHRAGPLQQRTALDGDEFGVAGAGADEPDCAAGCHGEIFLEG